MPGIGTIATLFHYGAFETRAIASSALPLTAYSAGLVGIILAKILAPAFYARQDIRTPVKIVLGVLVATQLMNLVFVPRMAVAGLALSISLGACLNAIFLYAGLRRGGIHVPQPGWLGFVLKLGAGVGVMGAICWYCAGQVEWAAIQAHPWMRAGALLLIVTAGAATSSAAPSRRRPLRSAKAGSE